MCPGAQHFRITYPVDEKGIGKTTKRRVVYILEIKGARQTRGIQPVRGKLTLCRSISGLAKTARLRAHSHSGRASPARPHGSVLK
jgi:hypothetical protein